MVTLKFLYWYIKAYPVVCDDEHGGEDEHHDEHGFIVTDVKRGDAKLRERQD